jgi:hypothetical protein
VDPKFSYLKYGNLNCRQKLDLKFQEDACFVCSKVPTTAVMLKDMITGRLFRNGCIVDLTVILSSCV